VIALVIFLCLASALGLFTAEAIRQRSSPRTRAGFVLLLAGLILAALYAFVG